MKKPGLSFYTNIPTPYQLDFFSELSELFELTIIYYSATESNRSWQFSSTQNYEVILLKNNFLARIIQRKIIDFHFSWKILSVSLKDRNQNIVVGAGYWLPNSIVALLVNKLRGKKIAYFSEPLFPSKNIIIYLLKWLFLRIPALCCNAIFCIGKKSAETFDAFKVNQQKFIINYNINPVPFNSLNSEKILRYRKIYKNNGEFIILSSGALIERKGMDILIKAFKEIQSENIRLLLIGDGPQKEELEKLAANDKRIVFSGFQTKEDIPFFFGIADIFVFASRYDGWGVVINEAIAANLPIISSNKVGAAVELINSPENGIICESEQISSFKAAMETLIFDTKKRKSIKENAHQLIPFISSKHYAKQVYNIFLHQIAK